MAKIKYVVVRESDAEFPLVDRLVRANVVSCVRSYGVGIIARHGVNKTTLKKILEKSI